jgi:hypothetical protein
VIACGALTGAGFLCRLEWEPVAPRKASCGPLGVGYAPFKGVDLFGKASVSAGAFSIAVARQLQLSRPAYDTVCL